MSQSKTYRSQLAMRVVIAAVLVFGLSACGKKASPTSKEVTQPVQTPAPQPVSPRAAPSVAPRIGAAAAPAPSADQVLGQKVKSQLNDQGVDVRGIDVVASHGNVTLFGTVDTPAQRVAAGRAAQRVPGVKSVKNSLAVVAGS